MAIIVKLKTCMNMQDELNKLIYNNLLTSWIVDDEGDFTIKSPHLVNHAWIRIQQKVNPSIDVKFGIVTSKQYRLTNSLYATYHCRFAEILLTYFDDKIDKLEITPLLVTGIDVFPLQY